ncbi:MAG: L-seryl-tRNA(Sec) selenium transferase [Calditrichaeota bacterium]|nr:MAG: L-seryl-tRNA(Sec) selenium transferase [Calditrichota bacterium]
MAKDKINSLRDFPSIEEILQNNKLSKEIELIPRALAAEIAKMTVAELKRDFKTGKELTESMILSTIASQIKKQKRKEITKVINATGVVVHTNLGRAPLSEDIFDEIKKTVIGYGNIEFDLSTGKRGKRGEACEQYLAVLSEAESGAVVNNCAAALFMILNTFANRKEVVISRSELVQIGGGFRIPDILKKSGAKLHEVGSTNITSIKDYEDAISEKTGMILKVHQSNFIQKGFVEQASLKELVALGKKHQIPVLNDLGSGVFIPTKKVLGYSEPTVQMSVRDGATLTCFSGDKMLGGCQAGLIVGKNEAISKIKKNPLFRAFRADKIQYSILEKLLSHYLNNSWEENIKLWKILAFPESELYKRGKKIQANVNNPEIAVEATQAYVGGGALPESDISSVGIIFSEKYNPNLLYKKFRELPYPVIGRIDKERFILDLKSVDEADLFYLEKSIEQVLSK